MVALATVKPLHERLRRSLFAVILSCVAASAAFAQTPAAPPTTEERLTALEAYMTNSDPGKSLAGVPGPGHNAWMMTSSALVLLMTGPGLLKF